MAEILVVEDYPLLATLLSRTLRKQGHAVERALTMADALTFGDRKFNQAVLDIDLPDGNGVALAEHLLHHHCVEHVLFFTATREDHTLARAAEMGRVIDKSRGVDQLLLEIARIDDQARQPTEPPPVSRVMGLAGEPLGNAAKPIQLELFGGI